MVAVAYGTGEQAGSESETPARWFCWFDNYSNAVNGGSASFAEECVCVCVCTAFAHA